MSDAPHINQVRAALLDTLADLRNRETPMDLDRAKVVATVASVLVDTAKAENEYLRITGQDRSAFMKPILDMPAAQQQPGLPTAHNPFPTVTRHHLEG